MWVKKRTFLPSFLPLLSFFNTWVIKAYLFADRIMQPGGKLGDVGAEGYTVTLNNVGTGGAVLHAVENLCITFDAPKT